MMMEIVGSKPDAQSYPHVILIRKIFTLLAAICDNPHNGVDVKPLAKIFMPILFDIPDRHKLDLEKVCACFCDF